MSSPTRSSRSSTTLGPITPTVDLTSHTYPAAKSIFDTTGSCWTAPFRDGLPTPPSDMTGVAYNAIPPTTYGGKSHAMPSHLYSNIRSHHYGSVSSSMVASTKHSNHSATHSAPAPVKEAPVTESTSQGKSSGSTATSVLRVPSSINNSNGTLAEFAAQMTCLFWFEKTSKLQAIEDRRDPVLSLVPEAFPTVGFQKWVTSILATTQVSQNVILLALLFIYRLKKFNSGVKGKKGSEFRLMTVALMLGNKYLDDNTYTNKTWAEVSGIAVQEIHIMEVEFLSNIRYDLFASKEKWAEWHSKLGLFSDYFNQASKLPAEGETPLMRFSPPRLQAHSPLSKLPSPPVDAYRPHSQPQPNWFGKLSGLPYSGTSSPVEAAVGGSRKRSRDDEEELHPLKRVAMTAAQTTPSSTISSATMSSVVPSLPPVLTPTSAPVGQASMVGHVARLPPPNLPASNAVPQSLPSSAGSQLPVPALMPTVYNRNSNWAMQMPSSAVPSTMASSIYNTTALPELGRHQNPYGISSATVSPAVSAYSVNTPQKHLSPSYFLANRNSPYRPVRSVHTLLIPPPSTSMQPQRSVPFDHMHYQPLSKSSADRKTGLLPYIHPETWNQPHFQPLFPPTQFSG